MQLIKKMSRSWSNFSVRIILLLVFILCNFANCELESSNNGALEEMQNPVQEQINIPETISIRKCCPENHILVEYDFGHRSCQLRTKYATGNITVIFITSSFLIPHHKYLLCMAFHSSIEFSGCTASF